MLSLIDCPRKLAKGAIFSIFFLFADVICLYVSYNLLVLVSLDIWVPFRGVQLLVVDGMVGYCVQDFKFSPTVQILAVGGSLQLRVHKPIKRWAIGQTSFTSKRGTFNTIP